MNKIIENYLELGFNLIPIKQKDKKPLVSWKKYQNEKVTKENLSKWIKNYPKCNFAVICGKVSNNLTICDFDSLEGYQNWKSNYPELARTLPTVSTSRGKHIFFKSDFNKIVYFKNCDGELRGSGYCIIPPSIHPSGLHYKWDIPLTQNNYIELNPYENGFLNDYSDTNESIDSIDTNDTNELNDIIESIINDCLPKEYGERNRKIFELVKEFKSHPILKGKKIFDLQPIFKKWFTLALPNIRTKDYDESLKDFIITWNNYQDLRVDFPKIIGNAKKQTPPKIILELFPDDEPLHIFSNICRELQKNMSDNPFFIPTRKGANILDTYPLKITRYFQLLESIGLVKKVKEYDSYRSPRYMYIGDLNE